MRKITEIIIHCSATQEGKHFTVSDIERWHRAMGFRTIGYHYVVYLDGSIHPGRPLVQCGAHCTGHNLNSIGICYVGGLRKDTSGTPSWQPADTRTPAQRKALKELIESLLRQHPCATLHGHNEFAAKACPCFKVPEEL